MDASKNNVRKRLTNLLDNLLILFSPSLTKKNIPFRQLAFFAILSYITSILNKMQELSNNDKILHISLK